jgi:hypothetical protein
MLKQLMPNVEFPGAAVVVPPLIAADGHSRSAATILAASVTFALAA